MNRNVFYSTELRNSIGGVNAAEQFELKVIWKSFMEFMQSGNVLDLSVEVGESVLFHW